MRLGGSTRRRWAAAAEARGPAGRLLSGLRAAARERPGPLSAEACLERAGQVLGPTAAGAVIGRIFERSSGNACFSEELVRAEAEGRGGELPDTVLAMMQSMLATLEPEARRVLR